MALILCKDCKKEFSTDTKHCPHCGAKKFRSRLILKAVLLLLFFGVIITLWERPNATTIESTWSSPASPSTPPKPVLKKLADPIKNAEAILLSDTTDTKFIVDAISDLYRIEKEENEERYNLAQELIKKLGDKREEIYVTLSGKPRYTPSPWSYFSNIDKTGGGTIYFASVDSINNLSLDFPYGGLQRANLQLRTHPRLGQDIIFSVEKGQILCKYNDCSLLIRFDEDKPIRFNAKAPEDHSSTSLLIADYQTFVNRMVKSRRVRIEVEFFRNGTQTLEFDISKFDKVRYIEKKK